LSAKEFTGCDGISTGLAQVLSMSTPFAASCVAIFRRSE